MKNKRALHILTALLLCISLLLSLCAFAGADFGDFGGDGDYGGGDDGGGWDFGGGWDDDDDFGTRDSGSSSSGEGNFGIVAVEFIVVIAVFVFISFLQNRKRSKAAANAPKPTDASELTPMAQYTALDPGFNADQLTQKLRELYVQMQQCWTAKDISSLRPYFSDTFYAQMERQLDAHKAAHRTNHIDDIEVQSVKLLGYRQQAGTDEIIAEVQTKIVDYTVEDATGALVSGSTTAKKLMTYEYLLTRPTGKTTLSEDQTAVTVCPNCGAPVSISRTAECPFCGSIITVSNETFVINGIRGICQKTL